MEIVQPYDMSYHPDILMGDVKGYNLNNPGNINNFDCWRVYSTMEYGIRAIADVLDSSKYELRELSRSNNNTHTHTLDTLYNPNSDAVEYVPTIEEVFLHQKQWDISVNYRRRLFNYLKANLLAAPEDWLDDSSDDYDPTKALTELQWWKAELYSASHPSLVAAIIHNETGMQPFSMGFIELCMLIEE